MLVVDDVLTTGGSVKKVLKLLDEAGADIKGVGFLIDRTNGGVDFGVPFFACHPMDDRQLRRRARARSARRACRWSRPNFGATPPSF